jgi:hypothetical protein
LAPETLFPFTGQRCETQCDHHQRQHHRDDPGGRQIGNATGFGGVLGRPETCRILIMRLDRARSPHPNTERTLARTGLARSKGGADQWKVPMSRGAILAHAALVHAGELQRP